MLILALDSSSPTLSCALVDLGLRSRGVLAEQTFPPPDKAGDLLPEVLAALCARAGVAFADVEAFAAGLGPGSFTGLRVGLAAVKALAYAQARPVAGASSLHALVRGAGPGLVCAALEARRGELFVLLARDGVPLLPERVVRALELPALLQALGEPVTLLGAGAHANRAALPGFALREDLQAPPAAEIARLCFPALQGQAFDAARCFGLAPNYLQPSTAEVALAEGRVGGLPR